MVSVLQRSADLLLRYAIVDADRQGVIGPLPKIGTSLVHSLGRWPNSSATLGQSLVRDPHHPRHPTFNVQTPSPPPPLLLRRRQGCYQRF